MCGGTPILSIGIMTTDIGSIPACAGEANTGIEASIPSIPAVRGNQSATTLTTGPLGLSPRVRGNQHFWARATARLRSNGSIPACAGEPTRSPALCSSASWTVYPRVCGGTSGTPGNARRSMAGSIPACAGEPRSKIIGPPQPVELRVYPRVCGGTRHHIRQPGETIGSVYPRVCGGTSR